VRILAALGDGGHLVAGSYGALAAMLAAELNSRLVHSLVLCEPACFSVARGCPAVDAHVAALAPVFAVAGDRSVSNAEFSGRFAAGMGTPAPDLAPGRSGCDCRATAFHRAALGDRCERARAVARAQPGLDRRFGSHLRRGRDSLVALGARHVAPDGAGHRTQDRADGVAAIAEFWSDLRGRP
jgi:pimeloyl-ACP methyl ester carboxylesterase